MLDMMLHGWPVLSVLLVVSIWSVSVIWDRLLALRAAKSDVRSFVGRILKLIDEGGVTRALQYCDQQTKPVAQVVSAVLLQPGSREDRERAMRNAIQFQIHELERRVVVLGTVGSTAPFIGLFGTVVGIMKAFRDIAVNAGAGPEVVGVGIAEALVTTAAGLIVAIPAVIFYNYFSNSIQRFADELDTLVFHVIEKAVREERR